MRGAALAAAVALTAPQAGAGAWTQAPGAVFLSLSASHFATDDGDFEESSVALYGEYGVTERLTLGGVVEGARSLGGRDEEDLKFAALARWRLFVGEAGDPFSVQVTAGDNVGDLVPADPGREVANETEVDLRALYGRGFDSPLGPGWVNLEGGVRFQLGDAADEIRLDATVGVRPAPRWLAMVQSFNTLGLRNQTGFGADYSVAKIAPSIGYELTDSLTLVLTAEREVAGRNISRGARGRVSLWASF